MPGPGGGGHGGGGGRGGFGGGSHGGGFGGGPGGGSFGGGRPDGGFYGGQPRGGFHGPHMGGGWHFGPRRYRGGGGCCGGFMGMLVLPLFIIFLIIYLLIPSEGVNLADGYNEEQFQDFANSQYVAEFGSSSAYEDNLLLTVLVEDENYYNYYYIAWIGDHIETDINDMMGDNNTELGRTLENCINDSSYKYSLDSNLAQAVKSMTEQVAALRLDSSFLCDENHIQVKSHLTNRSSVEMTEETVNAALTAFTEKTGIPIVIVVEDMDDVFGKTVSSGGLNVGAIVVIAAVIIAVVAIVITIRKQKNTGAEYGNNKKDSRYHDFDDQY